MTISSRPFNSSPDPVLPIGIFKHVYSSPHRGSDLECKDPSLAQQQFAADADINVMLERFKVTGQMPQGFIAPSYGDFNGVTDYRTAVEAVRVASNSFMDLPANIRSRFENNPQNLMDFLADKANYDEASRLGLVPFREPVAASAAS